MSRRLRARIGLGLLSVAGTSAGHYLAYWIAAPDSHHRDELLEATGHAGESPLLVIGGAAFLATCIAALAGRPSKRAPRFGSTLMKLAVLQILAFVGLEVAERLSVHASLLDSMREPVFVLGVAAQLLVAVLGALLLKSLHAIAGVTSSVPPARSFLVTLLAAPNDRVVTRHAYRIGDARGPPLSS